MLADGSFDAETNKKELVQNNGPDKPRILTRDFKDYGGRCKAGDSISYSWQQFNARAKKIPHYLTSYAHFEKEGKMSLYEKFELLNNNAIMASGGKDRGIYYISNAPNDGQSVGDADDAVIKSYTKHQFGDMDTLYSYGFSDPEILQVHQSVIDHIKDGVPVISKEKLLEQLKN